MVKNESGLHSGYVEIYEESCFKVPTQENLYETSDRWIKALGLEQSVH